MAVRKKRLPRAFLRVKGYPTDGVESGTTTIGKARRMQLPDVWLLYVFFVPGEHTVEAIEKVLLFPKTVWFSRIHDQLGFHTVVL
jgi:hypothetical protein